MPVIAAMIGGTVAGAAMNAAAYSVWSQIKGEDWSASQCIAQAILGAADGYMAAGIAAAVSGIVNVVRVSPNTVKASKGNGVLNVEDDLVRNAGKGGTYTKLDDGLNFSNKALEHMGEGGRQVPVQTLQNAIRYGEAIPDPRGSSATMYYTTMYKNGKMYNLEVLYDEVTNTVYHFKYARKAMGNLPAISK